jgi:hypothetical protein
LTLQNRNFTPVFAVRTSCSGKGLDWLDLKFQDNFTPVFDFQPPLKIIRRGSPFVIRLAAAF